MPNHSYFWEKVQKVIEKEKKKKTLHRTCNLSPDVYRMLYDVPRENNSDQLEVTQLKSSISADTIEDAVVQLLKKYNLLSEDVKEPSIKLENEKTFTLNEIIKIIDSLPNRNVNTTSLFENTGEILVNKNELLNKFKDK